MFVSSLPLCELEETFQIPGSTDSYAFARASISHTTLARLPASPGIVAALTWPASLLSVANVIDNPWGVCLHRSAEVGKHLAHILLSRQQVPRDGDGGVEWAGRQAAEACIPTHVPSVLMGAPTVSQLEAAPQLWGRKSSLLPLKFKSGQYPRKFKTTHECSSKKSDSFFQPPWTPAPTWHNTHIHINKINL